MRLAVLCAVAAIQCAGAGKAFAEEEFVLRINGSAEPEVITLIPRSVPVIDIEYGAALDPRSFRAIVDGRDITALFQPELTPKERVELPVGFGQSSIRFTGCSFQYPAGQAPSCEAFVVEVEVRRALPSEATLEPSRIEAQAAK